MLNLAGGSVDSGKSSVSRLEGLKESCKILTGNVIYL